MKLPDRLSVQLTVPKIFIIIHAVKLLDKSLIIPLFHILHYKEYLMLFDNYFVLSEHSRY